MDQNRPRYQDRIVTDPRILVGKPVIKGTRISVELILERLSLNPDTAELFAGYPELTLDDVRACLAYAEALVEREEVSPPPRRRRKTGVVRADDPLFGLIGIGRSGIPGGLSGKKHEALGRL